MEFFPDSWFFWGHVQKSQGNLHFASSYSSWRYHHPSGLNFLHYSCPHRFASWRDPLTTSHAAKSASDFDMPAKMSEVALPVVGYEASEMPPELWGSAFWLGMKGHYHFQSAEWDMGNIICLWPWNTIWMHRQRVTCCVPHRKQLLKICMNLYEHSQPMLPFLEAMNSNLKCLWYLD